MNRMIRNVLIFFLLVLRTPAFSQHDHHAMEGMDMDMGDTAMSSMSHSFSRHLPMNRDGSGTGWLPDNSPMFGSMIHAKKWMYMIHGSAFIRYNSQDISKKGSRGDSKVDAPNWLMFMGQRQVGEKGLFHFSGMFSVDALIAGGSGYPLLYQTGESFRGKPLVDRQHPHDLFSELSVSYSYAVNKNMDLFAYLGYPGEPALGPVTFMHRPSALDNPNAPISHHWVDATHITFGVATLGVRAGRFKLDGSLFTGREPDENRYDFDKPRFDSWSGRLSFNPDPHWALQISHGYVKSPEELHPEENIYKTVASAIYTTVIKNGSYFAGTALWGMNKMKDHDGENAAMLEGSWRFDKNVLYTRYEYTQKSAEELVMPDAGLSGRDVFNVNEFTVGYNRDLLQVKNIKVAAGANYSVNHADAALNGIYGKNPSSLQIYLRFYPAMM